MRTRVRKWGNSLGLRIPKAFAHEADVAEGSPVEVSVVEGRIVVTPISARRYTLEVLLAAVTTRNRHAEIATGGPQGREVW
jgi:antitoxin MazE